MLAIEKNAVRMSNSCFVYRDYRSVRDDIQDCVRIKYFNVSKIIDNYKY